jgi:mono/diheme cytochrome c family protein
MRNGMVALVLALSFAPAAMADSAADVWKAKCKACHGEDGRGQTKVGRKEKIADLTSATWQREHSDKEIRTVIKEGSPDNSKMKAFGTKLSEQEIDSLVKYIRGLKAS